MADVIKNSYNEANGFQKVIFQRGKDVLDFELNEFQDVLRVQQYRSTRDGVQGGDDPGSNDDGFLAVGSGLDNEVNLQIGTLMAGGYPLFLDVITSFSGFTTAGAPRTDILYLTLNEQEVADPAEIPQLGETSRRTKLVVTLNVAEGVPVPANTSEEIWEGGTHNFTLASVARSSGVAAIAFVDVTDKRFGLPTKVVTYLEQRVAAPYLDMTLTQAGVSDDLIAAAYIRNGQGTGGNQYFMLVGDAKRIEVTKGAGPGSIISTITPPAEDANYKAIANAPSLTADGTIVLAGHDGVGTARVHRSTNGGQGFVAQTPANTEQILDVIWVESLGLFIAVGGNTVDEVATSVDGSTWVLRSSNIIVVGSNILRKVRYGNGVMLAVSSNAMIRSTDGGTTWALIHDPVASIPFSTAGGFEFSNTFGLFVLQAEGRIFTSSDGLVWLQRADPFVHVLPFDIAEPPPFLYQLLETEEGLLLGLTIAENQHNAMMIQVRESLDVPWDSGEVPSSFETGIDIGNDLFGLAVGGGRAIVVGDGGDMALSNRVVGPILRP